MTEETKIQPRILKNTEAKKKYVERWDSHINELSGIGWYLQGDDFKTLKEKIEELKKLVRIAVNDVEELHI